MVFSSSENITIGSQENIVHGDGGGGGVNKSSVERQSPTQSCGSLPSPYISADFSTTSEKSAEMYGGGYERQLCLGDWLKGIPKEGTKLMIKMYLRVQNIGSLKDTYCSELLIW